MPLRTVVMNGADAYVPAQRATSMKLVRQRRNRKKLPDLVLTSGANFDIILSVLASAGSIGE